MLAEDLRSAHEDVERLEAAIAERILDEPKHVRNKLAREHEIANFTARITDQSQRALNIYNNQREQWTQEIQSMAAGIEVQTIVDQRVEPREARPAAPRSEEVTKTMVSGAGPMTIDPFKDDQQDERDIQTTYTGIPGNMLKHEYNVSRALEDGANATRLLSGQRQNGRPSQHKTTSLRYSACLYAFNARE
jgi:hypothetical protein